MPRELTPMNHLRIFRFDEEESTPAPSQPQSSDQVTVAVGDVLPLLAGAVADNQGWLRDFENEEITVSNDLYDVIMAYHHFHRPTG